MQSSQKATAEAAATFSESTRYAQGTGELIVGDILNALHELKK